MPVELTGTYTAAVDKGTLDAIASADGDNVRTMWMLSEFKVVQLHH